MHEGFATRGTTSKISTIGRISPATGSDWCLRATAKPKARIIVEAHGAGITRIFDEVVTGSTALRSLGATVAAAHLVVKVAPDGGVSIDHATVDIGWRGTP